MEDFPSSSQLGLDFKHGQLLSALQSVVGQDESTQDITSQLQKVLQGRKLYDPAWQWEDVVSHLSSNADEGQKQIKWLQDMIPAHAL